MSLRLNILLVMCLMVAVACAVFSVTMYQRQKQDLLRGIDEKLVTAAYLAESHLPPRYHDGITDRSGMSSEEYTRIVDANNRLCLKLNLQYLWSVLAVDSNIVFTSATSPGKDVSKGDHAGFFDVHQDPLAFKTVFETMQIDHSSFHNEWGHGRMVLIPGTDSHGRRYCFGASVSLAEIDALLRKTLWQSLLISMAFLLAGLAVSVVLANSLARPIARLTFAAEEMAKGNYFQKVAIRGSTEVESLARTLNGMGTAIADKIMELENSYEHLRITLQSIGDAVIATDNAGHVVSMNPMAENLTGWKASEAHDRLLADVFRIVNAETGEPVANPVQRVLKEGQVVGLADHTTLIARDGTERRIADSGAPIRNVKGHIVGVVLVFRDITERQMLEEQIQHARKMESVGHLAGGVAHDFSNMLTGIMGAAELLAKRVTEDPIARRFVEMIIDTSARAGDLTSRLLAFARKGRVVVKPFDLHTAVRDAIDLLNRAVDKRITVIQKIDAPCHTVVGDSSQIMNAVLNLGLNARDAMPSGGSIVVSTGNVRLDEAYCASCGFELQPGLYIQVSVRDSGMGMTHEVMSHIFEPFFTTKGIGRGTGLGLSSVYGTVREHRGAITVYSQPGQGTVFHMFFPVTDMVDVPEPKELAEVAPGHGRVLIVDDEEVIRITAGKMLEELGYEVLLAAHGKEAVAIYEREWRNIDAVVLDVVMPEMNGIDCLHALLALNPAAKILISSGFIPPEQVPEMGLEGIAGFVKKPYRRLEFSRIVAGVVGRQS